MKVLKPDVKPIVEPNKIKLVERVARTCYKSEDLITEEWKHIFDLRLKGTTGAPHPQMQEVMEKCYYSYMHDLTDGRI